MKLAPLVSGIGLCVVAAGCLEPNPNYRRPPDLAEQCPGYVPDAGAARSRPEVLVKGGDTPVGGTGSFPVADFYLDVNEITVGAYRECVSAGRCGAPRDMAASQYCNWTPCPGKKENHPINCIHWQQASDFCAWAGRRLPTEAEWEYAAGGPAGMASKYPWGMDEPVTAAGVQLCWSRSDGTCEVRQYALTLNGARTQKGVADLAGGVYEWTGSEYAGTYMHPAKDCVFMKSSSCSLRGGSWLFTNTDYFRAANRGLLAPTLVSDYVGARCARTP